MGIARALQREEWHAVFLLGPTELEHWPAEQRRDLEQAFPVLEALPLHHVLTVLSLANAFVGNDSGVSHMAGAIGVRTFTVFGPTDPRVYHPLGDRVEVLRTDPETFITHTSPELQTKVLNSLLK